MNREYEAGWVERCRIWEAAGWRDKYNPNTLYKIFKELIKNSIFLKRKKKRPCSLLTSPFAIFKKEKKSPIFNLVLKIVSF